MVTTLASAIRTAFPPQRLVRFLSGLWQSLQKRLVSPYHPERHYMRGPGPKWHAKHACPASERPPV